MAISNEELEELCAKLASPELGLSENQRRLLDAVLKIAWDYAGTHTDLNAEFSGCFAPGEAEVIMSYHSATPVTTVSKSITRADLGSSITCAVPPSS